MIKDVQEYLELWEKENNPFYPNEMKRTRVTANEMLRDYKGESMKTPFIAQTAIDYDLPYHIVESIYDKYNVRDLFYEMLEDRLRESI